MSELMQDKKESKESWFFRDYEVICGLVLAMFAAVLAVADLGGGKYGDDEIIATNEKASQYSWYQSKSIKQSLMEGQRDLLLTLLDSGSIIKEQTPAIEGLTERLNTEIQRYNNEKREILLGSSKVGQENWCQEIDGKLGVVTGAKEWEEKLAILCDVGDIFDKAVLYLQLSLVMGAISIVLKEKRVRVPFFTCMVGLGIVGTIYTILAFNRASIMG